MKKGDSDKEKLKLITNSKYTGFFSGKFPSTVKDDSNRPKSNIDFLHFLFPSDFDRFIPIWIVAKSMAKGKLDFINGENPEMYDTTSPTVLDAARHVESYFKKDDKMLDTIVAVFNETKKRRVVAHSKLTKEKAKVAETSAKLKNLDKMAMSLLTKK